MTKPFENGRSVNLALLIVLVHLARTKPVSLVTVSSPCSLISSSARAGTSTSADAQATSLIRSSDPFRRLSTKFSTGSALGKRNRSFRRAT